jgi:hypothetical protein
MAKHVLFSCPSANGKGILVSPTVDGNLILGPTARAVDDREDTATTDEGLWEVQCGARHLVPDVNTRADFHFFMEEFGSWSDWAAPFGSRNANSYQFFAGAARQNGRDDWFRRFSNNGTDGGHTPTGEPSVVGEHFFSLNKMTYTLDGYTDTFTAYAIFSKTYNAYVFAVNNNNAAAMHSPMKLYSLKIWDDGTLARNFIPCVNKEGVAGLYDITPGAVKKFYANDGTGEFEAGPELVARTGFAVYVH